MSTRHKFDGLLSQWNMLENVIQSRWAKLIDVKVAQVIIDKYYKSKGLTSISIRQIAEVTGKQHKYICPSINRLVDRGVISVARLGAGKRASEYSLNFDFGKNPRVVTADTASSAVHVDTTLGFHTDTTNTASGVNMETNPCLDNRPIGRLILSSTSPAVPSAQPLAGLPPASAGAAVDLKKAKTPFDEIWNVWPRKTKLASARDAYNKLSPNDELHAEILAAANAWATHYKSENTEQRYVKLLHNWLTDEVYREDLPLPYEKSKTKNLRTASTTTFTSSGLSLKTPLGEHDVEIVDSEFATPDGLHGDSQLRFDYRIRNGKYGGKKFSHKFFLVCVNDNDREAGQQFFADVRKATGVRDDLDDTSELHGKTLRAIVSSGGRIKYNKL